MFSLSSLLYLHTQLFQTLSHGTSQIPGMCIVSPPVPFLPLTHLGTIHTQGDETVDMDLPTTAEGNIFRSSPMKLLFVFLMPGFYSLR